MDLHMKQFVKIVPNEFVNEARDLRELAVVASMGIRVAVIARGAKKGIEEQDGWTIHRLSTRPLGQARFLVPLNRAASLFTWAAYVRRLRPDCISCHDLAALLIGWLSALTVPARRKPALVYDSHEFELGRSTAKARGRMALALISGTEKFLMERCAFSIMVNDSIADEVQRIHRLRVRPVVVRNIPEYRKIDGAACRQRRREICDLLRAPEDAFLAMYHGGISQGRGLEVLLEALGKCASVYAVILGSGEPAYIADLKAMSARLGIGGRVLFLPAVKVDVLWQYVGAADVGIVTIPGTCRSYYYMLPNKFFENIQSETPVIASDFPEFRNIVTVYVIGFLADPGAAAAISAALERMRTDRELYHTFKENIRRAKAELCWEKEREVLKNAYACIWR